MNNLIKGLALASLLGLLTFAMAGGLVFMLVFPLNVTVYLHPLQLEFSVNNQAYLVSLVTSTPTPFQPASTATSTPTLTSRPTFTSTQTPTICRQQSLDLHE